MVYFVYIYLFWIPIPIKINLGENWGGIWGKKGVFCNWEWGINSTLHGQWKIPGTGLLIENLSLCHLLVIDIISVFIICNPKKTNKFHQNIVINHLKLVNLLFLRSNQNHNIEVTFKYLISIRKYLNYFIIVYFT